MAIEVFEKTGINKIEYKNQFKLKNSILDSLPNGTQEITERLLSTIKNLDYYGLYLNGDISDVELIN